MSRRQPLSVAIGALFLCGAASAQEVAFPDPIVPPAPTTTQKPGEVPVATNEIDLANVVTSAAKGITTVQEAPAIVTIITADDIRARGFKWLSEALATVPGWMETAATGDQLPGQMMVRGVSQGVLLLRDGVSLFEPWGNNTNTTRTFALENVKRIEVVTGPGGVLWGANSFMGIVNVITKDAEDVGGMEISAGYGDGPGNKQDFKAYVLFGKTFFNDRLKIFQHVSYESYLGTIFTLPGFLATGPAPQPAGPVFYGQTVSTLPQRSWLVNIDGKYSLGPVSLYYQVPFGEGYPQLTFSNAIVPKDNWAVYDRYGILEYKDRYLNQKVGLTVKGYYTQFVRSYDVNIYPSSALLPDGLAFSLRHQFIQRTGVTVDSDANLPFNIRLLYGGEFFWEGVSGDVAKFSAPSNPALLPILCPVNADGTLVPNCPRQYVNDASRYVAALYLNAQWHPFSKLTLDGGVRLQEGFGQYSYTLTPLGAAAIVWNFLPDFHIKANFAQGFRPPVFNDVAAAPGGVSFGSSPHLKNELSQSFQFEFNARVLRNTRKIRELQLRVDYSYTVLKDLIQLQAALYENTGNRAIQSVEALAKLYLQGDHFLTASYTFLYTTASDVGVVRALPMSWVSLGASFNLIRDTLDVNTNLLITGAYRDPNRYTSGPSPLTGSSAGTQTLTTDLTFDRLTPVALLQLGIRARFLQQKISVGAQFYNVLNQHYYYPDIFYDLTANTEVSPTPAPGFNFFGTIAYHPTF